MFIIKNGSASYVDDSAKVYGNNLVKAATLDEARNLVSAEEFKRLEDEIAQLPKTKTPTKQQKIAKIRKELDAKLNGVFESDFGSFEISTAFENDIAKAVVMKNEAGKLGLPFSLSLPDINGNEIVFDGKSISLFGLALGQYSASIQLEARNKIRSL